MESPDQTRKVIKRLLSHGSVSPGPISETTVTHDRLAADLRSWAKKEGFSETYKGFQGGQPDVLLFNPGDSYLFVGDAKNSENETPATKSSFERIHGYVEEFASLWTVRKKIKGGMLAIATDSKEEAQNWCVALTEMCEQAGLPVSESSFKVTSLIGKNTHIAHC